MKRLLFATLLLASGASAQTSAPLGLGVDTTAMDRTVRPQDDLFRYTNGRWLETVQIPDDKSRYGSFDILREKAEADVRAIVEDAAAGRVDDPDAQRIAAVYTAYMDSARVDALGVTPLAPDFARIDAIASRDDLARYFAANARGTFGPSPLAAFVTVDARNSGQHITALWQTGTGLPDRSYYLEDGFADERAAYVDYLATIHDLADLPGDAQEAARTVLALETEIARHQWTRVENRDPEARYNKMAWTELVATYPQVRLPILLSGSGFPAVDSVIVNQPSYVAALNTMMRRTPLEDWKTWARLQTVSEAAGLLSKPFAEANFDFFGRTLSGQTADRVRWKKAVGAASGALGEGIGRVYVARHFPPEAKARMDEMIRNLQVAMRQSISELEWMTDETKQAALAKLDDYTFKIGYPDEWEDYSALDLRPDDLIGNTRKIAAWNWEDMLSDLGQAPDRAEWGMTPQTVNAYYNPSFNEIVFPAAILQPPFFNVEADDAVNYGGIGAVIGHEFSHGFDDQGSQYDGQGNLRNWWSEADRTEFEALTDRLVAQYDGYEPLAGETVNGRLTLGENIADLAGLTMAYRAYRLSLDGEEAPIIDGYTGDQRVFLGWAQVWRNAYRDAYLTQLLKTDSHSPGPYRAVGPLSHIPAFYTAFGVEPGDGLYLAPEDRIKLW
ncbi:M13 family metallopeptidase [Rubricoccus marinus]|uniref:Peptidase M13 n=1 Tax=Rubricoccus marinus TaxID=716817 RepID=A0A259U3L2_9BACT|nr:M13 family metallopeptidase [Rubricoccus marinus]OZC04414.1 hypothetical protein BSZ36_16360 [Rubricoccus marinus]